MTIKKIPVLCRGQNLLSNMALEEKLWSPCFTRLGPKGTVKKTG